MEATGIGAIACGRHGCFIPHSVVDFQKGEQKAETHTKHNPNGRIPTIIDHKNNDFMDSAAPNYYDPLGSLDYLQYPHSPFGVTPMGRTSSLFPRRRSN